MAGFSLIGSPEFQAWASSEQRTWERQYLEVLAVLIEEYTARRERDTAIACARRFLATDDLVEDVPGCGTGDASQLFPPPADP